MWLCSVALKHSGRCGSRGGKKWLLLQNLCLTEASTEGSVIFWCGRGVQSQGFWVMGFFGAMGDLEELFTHNFIIGLLSWDPCQHSCLHLQLNSLKAWGWLSCKDWLLRCRTRISDEDDPDFSGCFRSREKGEGVATKQEKGKKPSSRKKSLHRSFKNIFWLFSSSFLNTCYGLYHMVVCTI